MYDAEISKKRAEIKIYSDLIAQLEADGCPFDVSDEELIAEHHPNCVSAARQLRERYNQIDNAREMRNELIMEVISMTETLFDAAGVEISIENDENDLGKGIYFGSNIAVEEFDNDAEEASARDPRPEMNCDKCGKETDDGVSHDDGSRYCFGCERE